MVLDGVEILKMGYLVAVSKTTKLVFVLLICVCQVFFLMRLTDIM
jgi:hypothetical protein